MPLRHNFEAKPFLWNFFPHFIFPPAKFFITQIPGNIARVSHPHLPPTFTSLSCVMSCWTWQWNVSGMPTCTYLKNEESGLACLEYLSAVPSNLLLLQREGFWKEYLIRPASRDVLHCLFEFKQSFTFQLMDILIDIVEINFDQHRSLVAYHYWKWVQYHLK